MRGNEWRIRACRELKYRKKNGSRFIQALGCNYARRLARETNETLVFSSTLKPPRALRPEE